MGAAVPNADFWRGRRVLLTGHTGFVGGWLAAWLARMGARVTGLALAPPTTPSFFVLTRLASMLESSVTGDVNDAALVSRVVDASDPQVVFHLAAQPIVRDAFRDPVGTFATNVMGTVNVLDACRRRPRVERIVAYTTDKVYRNDESGRPFVETDLLGGKEPYSASKAAADWAVAAYWTSYFSHASPRTAVATVRAGNIIGGGDWARDRLVPDAMRAFASGAALVIRNPDATRPWQHVLDVVRGTLVLAERGEAGSDPGVSLAWNFGPLAGLVHPVSEVAAAAAKAWGAGATWRHEPDGSIPEAHALVLSSEKAGRLLGWGCAWNLESAMRKTVDWYRLAHEGGDLAALTRRQIEEHEADAERGA
jgi:CDP-glucose 4,6-dehydratase